jgi:protein phosphatase
MEEAKEQLLRATRIIRNIQISRLDVEGKLVKLPRKGRAIIVGDLHGDLNSLKTILEESQFVKRVETGEKLFLVFLGDYIDRGPDQLGVLLKTTELLIENPSNIVMLRGNHEGPQDVIARPHDFPRKLMQKIGSSWQAVYNEFRSLAEEFYTAAIIPEVAFIAHGGIPTNTVSLEKIASAHIDHPDEPTLVEILWNDPKEGKGKTPSFRGVGHYFGEDVLQEFLREHGLNWLIRGHESASKGYMLQDKVLTLFSCKLPHYGNHMAAYLEMPLDERIMDIEDFIYQI